MGATYNNELTTTDRSTALERTTAEATGLGGGGGLKSILLANLRHRFFCCQKHRIRLAHVEAF